MASSRVMSRRDALDGGLRTAAWSMAGVSSSSGLILPSKRLPYAAAAEALDSGATPADIVVPKIQLGKSSLFISRTIQGYWQLAGGHGRYKESDALENMRAHYDAGITTLDTADIYGPSELIVGKFVASVKHQEQQQQQGKNRKNNKAGASSSSNEPIPCTKFCCFRFLDEIDRTEVKTRIQRACERLQVPKLPLVQFFWSNYDVKRYVDVALYLTELKEEGLIQEIGATNFDLIRLKELVNADVPLVSHQVQLSALDRRPVQSGMAEWCAEQGISLIAFGTVGSGILSSKYLGRVEPPTPEERNTASMRMYSATASRFGDWKLVQELLNTLNQIATRVREEGRAPLCSLSNVVQRYVLQTPAVAAVLIGVRNQDHLSENLQTHAFELNLDEMDAINAVVAKRRGPKGDVWGIERGLI